MENEKETERGRDRDRDWAFEKNKLRQTEKKMLKSGYARVREKDRYRK